MIVVRWSRRTLLLSLAVLFAATLAVIVMTRGGEHALFAAQTHDKSGDSDTVRHAVIDVRDTGENDVTIGSDNTQKEHSQNDSRHNPDAASKDEPHKGGSSSGSGSGLSEALLKILVLTYNRGASLSRCLESLNQAVYDGKRVAVEIHVDRGKNGHVHNKTLEVARAFVFRHGAASVHVKQEHGGVLGQWLDSWRLPPDNTSEIAVFVEDDISLSPYFARYLRRAHEKYDSYPAINGYALQADSIRHATGAKSSRLQGPQGQVVFLYPVLGSWGFSPHTGHWRHFVSWYEKASKQKDFVPAVPGLMPTVWYNTLRKQGRADSMWTMWHIHHAYQNHLFTVYTHLPEGKALAYNWREPGEHYGGRASSGKDKRLLDTWDDKQLHLPDKLMILDAKGENTGKVMTPAGIE